MNIGELKKIIADMPDDVEMFAQALGHEMLKVSASDWKVCFSAAGRNYWQFFDEDAILDIEKPIRALVIG